MEYLAYMAMPYLKALIAAISFALIVKGFCDLCYLVDNIVDSVERRNRETDRD